jgi:hypothetical protein
VIVAAMRETICFIYDCTTSSDTVELWKQRIQRDQNA